MTRAPFIGARSWLKSQTEIFSSPKKKVEKIFFCFSNVFKWIVWLFFSSDEKFLPGGLPLQIRLPSSKTLLKPPIRSLGAVVSYTTAENVDHDIFKS